MHATQMHITHSETDELLS